VSRSERYILGTTLDIGDRSIVPVVRIISITSQRMAIVTVDPAGILVRDARDRVRIALSDNISWDKIGDEIPEICEYRDPVMKNRDAGSGEGALLDLTKRTESEGPDSFDEDPDKSERIPG
jgi:hypothetical protein